MRSRGGLVHLRRGDSSLAFPAGKQFQRVVDAATLYGGEALYSHLPPPFIHDREFGRGSDMIVRPLAPIAPTQGPARRGAGGRLSPRGGAFSIVGVDKEQVCKGVVVDLDEGQLHGRQRGR